MDSIIYLDAGYMTDHHIFVARGHYHLIHGGFMALWFTHYVSKFKSLHNPISPAAISINMPCEKVNNVT